MSSPGVMEPSEPEVALEPRDRPGPTFPDGETEAQRG